MGTYVPDSFLAPDGLDDIGLEYGLVRLPDESLSDFRRRIADESRDRSGPSEQEFVRSINRNAGQFEVPVFDVELVLDGSGDPTAVDPFVEVTSTHLRAYSDYANETLDVEVDFTDASAGKFLRDIVTAFAAATHFTLTVLDSNHTYKRSLNLRYGNSERFIGRQVLLQRFVNDLGENVSHVSEFRGDDTTVFATEKSTFAAVTEDGDYYVDYVNGVVFTYTLQAGVCSYTYQVFPYRLYWVPVRVYPYNDGDLDYLHKDDELSDSTGLAAPAVLNSTGALVANTVLATHPIEWGE